MASSKNILKIIKRKRLDVDTDMVKLAIQFANNAHRGQKRQTGEPYINHSLATAETLAEMGLDESTIIAGVLHDVPEDTSVTIEEIEKNFGKDVAYLVNGVTKLGTLKYRGLERYIENLRKMFLTMAEDIRVILIKFADRLHNIKTLYALPPHKRKRIALETLEIYAPIANRLGMDEIKGKLEDLSFQYAYPDEFAWIQSQMVEQYHTKERHLKIVKKQLEEELKKEKIEYLKIEGRGKDMYSFYKKVMANDKDINKVHDLIALRVILKSIPECYTVLGAIHRRWRPIKGRVKDYIAQPKPNGYQSLHTTIFSDAGEVIEIQIRTQEMHEEASYGIAAHWHYDEKGSIKVDKKFEWVKDLSQWKRAMNGKEYLEQLKINVFQNRIFVFTPRGDVIDLPEGATPIDFGFHVHTDIGNKCTGARINGQLVKLDAVLKSGDMCEIIIDKNRKGPNPDWMSFAKTSTAKSHIKASRKKYVSIPSIWNIVEEVKKVAPTGSKKRRKSK